MTHTYRSIHHWDQWLGHSPGKNLVEAELHLLQKMLATNYGKHTVLLGVPHQHALLKSTVTAYHTLITPILSKNNHLKCIEGDLYELPVASGSVDLVLLPHMLECVDNPRQLLSEACRIVKPEGSLVICGFNPYSLWGVKKLFMTKKITPWSNHFIQPHTIKQWLQLADFEMVNQTSFYFRPPIHRHDWYQRLKFLEKVGETLSPALGAVNVLVAKAKIIPLTPMRVRWKQQLSGFRISQTMTGRIISNSK